MKARSNRPTKKSENNIFADDRSILRDEHIAFLLTHKEITKTKRFTLRSEGNKYLMFSVLNCSMGGLKIM
ncbi:MAG: hypothetical protein KKD39_02200 [Candidatus Altiarchaeota archaeon]|nr:hypothetical protein [Candidatus Altiarchaeota archaeon]